MSTKRKTKAQREAEQKAALLQRITDIYSGAQGSIWVPGEQWATAEVLANAMYAMKQIFGDQVEHTYMWELHCIKHFDSPEIAADFLFEAGIRA